MVFLVNQPFILHVGRGGRFTIIVSFFDYIYLEYTVLFGAGRAIA